MKRKPGKRKLERLKRLLKERKELEQAERTAQMIAADAVRNSPVPVVLKVERVEREPARTVPPIGQSFPKGSLDSGPMPPTLQGYSIGEILRMEIDGELDSTERKWVRRKKVRWDIRPYIPPERRRYH